MLFRSASGQECLDLLPRFQPHLIFMDLAMPGLDGWETLRRIRQGVREGRHGEAEIAVISANAFDKGADNDAGIQAADFITKPVRVDELLTWIGQRLGLEWIEAAALADAPPPAPPQPAAGDWQVPAAGVLEELRELVELGYPRGILAKLDEIAAEPAHRDFAEALRHLARQFQFDSMREIIRKARA